MGAMDLLLNEVENRFGMSGTKASSLLGSLLSTIQEQSGGLSGFLDKFRRAGLSDTVSSWLSGGPATAVSADGLQSALGSQTLSNIASRAGIPVATATTALGFVIPRLVQSLAPGGMIPTRLPAEAMSLISGPTGAVTAGARDVVMAVEQSGLRRYLWPLLAVLAAVLLYWFWPSAKPVAFNVEEQVRIASEKAMSALNSLKPGFSASDLSSAMNLEVINFASGSAQIPDHSVPFLNKAAEMIKLAPAGITIEIGGHTDNTGDATSNLALSQQRADAVRGYLVQQGVSEAALTAKGYGETRPLASNDTEAGKFRNRRIEFSAH